MKIRFSPERTQQNGDPTWIADEEDRDVSYEFRLQDLTDPDLVPADDHGLVALNHARQQLGVYPPSHNADDDMHVIIFRRQLATMIEEHGMMAVGGNQPTPVQFLLDQVLLDVDRRRPRDRSEIDRGYAVLATDLQKCRAWVALLDL